MKEQIYTNYRLQLPDRETIGTLVVRDGSIADIQPGIVSSGINGEGNYLMPGLIELHTDNLERCISPRPKIRWPVEAAASYHDRDLISAGITTVCDAIAIGDFEDNSARVTLYNSMIDVISAGQQQGKFATDRRLHLRCELSYENVSKIVEEYADNPLLCLISLMDHTPGQRQFVNLKKYKEYQMGKYGITQQEMEQLIEKRQIQQQKYAEKNRRELVEFARKKGITLASHDDATVAHVKEAVENGAAIAEFPTTIAAAKEARLNGLKVMMGAPNLVLGGSHSGNVSAMELVELDLVDIISSDYVPQSLLQSVFVIAQKTGKPIYETMGLVTSNPAIAIDLFGDRGSLEVGKRADLISAIDDGIVPRITSVISQGKRVA